MTSDLQADPAVLGAIEDALGRAGDGMGALAEGLPAGQDAGDAAAVVHATLANLIGGAGELAETAAALAGGVAESLAAYRGTDDAIVAALGVLGGAW
ncbi:MAG: hypothetical protein ACT4RN_03160 [Pseudonocardia sp.]